MKNIDDKLFTSEDKNLLTIDEIAKFGAQKILSLALESEVQEYIDKHKNYKDVNNKRLVVRNGKSRARTILTSCGEITIKAPRVNDRRPDKKFESNILVPWSRKSMNIEQALPLLYLKGLPEAEISNILEKLFGSSDQIKGLSQPTINSLKNKWQEEMSAWRKEPIRKEYAYLFADGVHLNIRLGDDKKICLLVVIGVSSDGEKHLLAVEGGFKESKEAWKSIFLDLENKGLKPPKLLIADGGLGLWAVFEELKLFKNTLGQNCWVHKIKNVLDKLPKRHHSLAKDLLRSMMTAESKDIAQKEFNKFKNTFNQYIKAVNTVEKNYSKLFAYLNFPKSHWQHIRTTNPIESAFATVKHRTRQSKGAGSKLMAETMAFKMLLEASKKWKKIKGAHLITDVLKKTNFASSNTCQAIQEIAA